MTNEQYRDHDRKALYKWKVLNFLQSKNRECSIEEILQNFPCEEITKDALKTLIAKSFSFYNETERTYKASKDGIEHLKIIQFQA